MSSRDGTQDGRLRVLALLIGAAAVLVGVALTLRPFKSLEALTFFVAASLILAGCSELLASRDTDSPARDRVAGGLLFTTGLVAALAPGLTVRGVAIVVGVGMVLSGGARVAAGWRGEADERYSALVGGLAGFIFGILALSWPDVTILVVALLVGPVTIVYGAGRLLRALRGPKPDKTPRRGRVRAWLRGVRATAALLFALVLVLISALVHKGSPTVTSFYSYTGSLPDKPGVLLREQPTTEGMPAGSRAVRILYTTTGINGRITLASGLVVASPNPPAGPRPVLLWEHGTTGVAKKCAPSLLPDPFTAGAMPATAAVIDRGWVLVAPDYVGLGASPPHPYLVGIPEAHSALDAVRAARHLAFVELGTSTVVWGHSQGGGAALWTGIEAASYAPDVPLAGVAALAPASDVLSLARSLQQTPSGRLFASFVISGYSDTYPDVSFNSYVRASAQTVVRRVDERCLSEPATILSLPAFLVGEQIFSRDLTSGPLATRLAQNVPDQPSGIPTLVAQGTADELVLPAVQRAFVRKLCRAGQKLEYRTYKGLDHVGVVGPSSSLIPYLLSWTQARFNGVAAPDNCATVTSAS